MAVSTNGPILEVRRYDGAVVTRGRRQRVVPCAVQPRDLALLDATHRHKFLTTPQLLEIGWPDSSAQAGRRRLVTLFRAGLLERFRPLSRRGSFPWTYTVSRDGFGLLQSAGLVPQNKRFISREVYDYRYVLHELHVNAWSLAWRRLLGSQLVGWHGESQIDVPSTPPPARPDGYTVQGLREPKPRLLRPDDLLEVARRDGQGMRTFLIEYDRTRRLDKNYLKFRRYDSFACSWWTATTEYGASAQPPWIVFVCEDDDHRALFLQRADHELTGHLWSPSTAPTDYRYVGRERTIFVSEPDVYAGRASGLRLPVFPPDHPARADNSTPRPIRLPGAISDCP